MQVSPEITYHNIPRSDWIEEFIYERMAHLERMVDDIVSCRVVVEQAQGHNRTGNPYRALVEVTIPPRKDLVAQKRGRVGAPKVEIRTIIRKAFDALEKQLKKEDHKRRGEVKFHEEPRAVVARLFPDEGYGFILGEDGEEYYFHQNAVLHRDFPRLRAGAEVRFEPELGEEGPQASTVQLVSRPIRPLANL